MGYIKKNKVYTYISIIFGKSCAKFRFVSTKKPEIPSYIKEYRVYVYLYSLVIHIWEIPRWTVDHITFLKIIQTQNSSSLLGTERSVIRDHPAHRSQISDLRSGVVSLLLFRTLRIRLVVPANRDHLLLLPGTLN